MISSIDKIGMENLPNAYIKKVTVDKLRLESETRFKVDVDVCVLDYKENETEKYYWYKSQGETIPRLMEKYLSTRCTVVIGASECMQEVVNGKFNVHDYPYEDYQTAQYGVGIVPSFIDSYEHQVRNTNSYPINAETGVVQMSYSFEFLVSSEIREHEKIIVFAQNFIDVGPGSDFVLDYNLDLGYTRNQHYLGPLSAEIALMDGDKPSTATLYKRGNGMPYGGAVHLHEAINQYMEGSFHRPEPHSRLVTTLTNNSKTVFTGDDMTYIGPILPETGGQYQFDHEAILEMIEDYNERQEMTSVVAVDYLNLLLRHDYSAAILLERNANMFHSMQMTQHVQLQEVAMLRSPVNSLRILNKLGTETGPQPEYDAEVLRLCGTTSKNNKIINKKRYTLSSGQSMDVDPSKIRKTIEGQNDVGYGFISESDINQATETSSITELDSVSTDSLKFLQLKDNTIRDEKGKSFKYGMEINFVSTFGDSLKQLRHEITGIISELDSFYQIASLPNAYDPSTKRYKEDFFLSYHTQQGFAMSKSPSGFNGSLGRNARNNILWVRACKVFSKVYSYLYPQDSSEIIRKIFNSLNLVSGTPEEIAKTIVLFRSLRDEFSLVYDVRSEPNSGLALVTSGLSTGGGSGNQRQSVYKHTKFFKRAFSARRPKAVGTNFIKLSPNKKDIPFLNKESFRKRVTSERNKFFKAKPNYSKRKDSGFDRTDVGNLMDIDTNSFSFFTPETIVIGGEEKNMQSTNNDVFDVDFFDKVSLIKSSNNMRDEIGGFSAENNTNFSTILSRISLGLSAPALDSKARKINETKPFQDAKDYLGDNSPFLSQDFDIFRMNYNSKIDKRSKQLVPFVASFSNSRRRKRVRRLKLKNFNPKEKGSPISKFFNKGKRSKELSRLPMQVKALIMSDSNSVRFPLSKMAYDPLDSNDTKEAFQQNFLNIKELKYLDGFEMRNGLRVLNQPIYKKVDSDSVANSKSMLCRLFDYEDNDLGITRDDNELPTFNPMFVMGDK